MRTSQNLMMEEIKALHKSLDRGKAHVESKSKRIIKLEKEVQNQATVILGLEEKVQSQTTVNSD